MVVHDHLTLIVTRRLTGRKRIRLDVENEEVTETWIREYFRSLAFRRRLHFSSGANRLDLIGMKRERKAVGKQEHRGNDGACETKKRKTERHDFEAYKTY